MEQFYLNDDEYEDGVPSIVEDFKGDFPSVVDRYFTRFYFERKSPSGENEDHLVLYHSNKLCVIGLAASHAAHSKGIASVNFDIGNCDRSQNQVKGKKKKGGMNLSPTTVLAEVTCSDNSKYKVLSCVKGRLIEVNSSLDNNLARFPIDGYNYIAVVLCKPEIADTIKDTLTSEEDYLTMKT